MDIEAIREEVYRFNRSYFFDISAYVDDNLDFIELNNFIVPKEDYIVLNDFLRDTAKMFRILDNNFMSILLKKISFDINNLNTYYHKIKTDTQNIKEIFEDEFINTSIYVTRLSNEIQRLRGLKAPSNHEIQRHSRLAIDYKELKTIYYDEFRDIFVDDKNYLLSLIKIALNSRIYYFNKFLSKEATDSERLQVYFRKIGIDINFNIRDYLLFSIHQLEPDTKEFIYLKSCQRIYK